MDFDFSDEQEQLRDAVRKWVDKAYGFDERRSVVAATLKLGNSFTAVPIMALKASASTTESEWSTPFTSKPSFSRNLLIGR